MKLLQLLSLLQRLPIRALLNVPNDFRDVKQLQPWVLAVIDTIQVLAEYTDTEIDDRALLYVEEILSDLEVWQIVDKLISRIQPTDVQQAAFNPMWILFIIQVLQMLLKMRRDKISENSA